MKNQNKYIFNLYRRAATDWQRYRPQYEWFTIDSVLSGSNQRWKELELKNPSLKRFMYAAKSAYQGYVEKFQDRYNVDDGLVKQFYNMYVGYHPAYGAYMVGVGPYVGDKQQDEENKFGYFTQRFPSTDSKNILYLIQNYCAKKNRDVKPTIDHLGVSNLMSVVAPEDFTLSIRHKKSDKKGEHGDLYDFVDITKEFLEENDYQKAIQESREPAVRPVLGLASKLQMKPSGVMKVLEALAKRDGQVKELNHIIDTIGEQMQIAPEDRRSESYFNLGYAKRIMEGFKLINPVTPLAIGNPRVTGSQVPESLSTNPEQISQIKLMDEICSTIDKISSEDPYLVAQALNSHPKRMKSDKRAQGTFDAESVKYWINNIQTFREIKDEDGNVVGIRSYAETSTFFKGSMEAIDADHNPAAGFDDMETALKFASLRSAESKTDEIDPATGAKINAVPPVFEKNYQQNITSIDLTKLRNGEDIEWDKKDLVSDEGEDDISVDEDEEFVDFDPEEENTFVDDPGIEDIDITKEPVKSIPESMPEPVVESIPDPVVDSTTPTANPPKIKAPRKNTRPIPVKSPPVDKTLVPVDKDAEVMAKVINKLKILSQDLNKKGLYLVSSNINQIINKYKRF